MDQTSIGSLNTGYRRGVIFGLTMAEILLMLLFCLLVALYFLTNEAQERRAEVEKSEFEIESLTTEIAPLRTSLEENMVENAALRRSLSLETARSEEVHRDNETLRRSLSLETARAEDLSRDNGALQGRVDGYGNLDPDFVVTLGELLKVDPIAYKQIFYVVTEAEDGKTDSIVVPRNQWQDLTTIKQKYSKIVAADVIVTLSEDQQDELTHAVEIIRSGDWPSTAATEDIPIKWPPIISLEEADGYSFPRGSAELNTEFTERLETDIFERVKDVVNQYGTRIVEVVGHTDEEPVGTSRTSNLDRNAIPALQAETSFPRLMAADNAGLGLARAISVTRVLQRRLASEPDFKDVVVLPYSAGHVIGLDERVSLGVSESEITDRNRRRIDIRLRRAALAHQSH